MFEPTSVSKPPSAAHFNVERRYGCFEPKTVDMERAARPATLAEQQT